MEESEKKLKLDMKYLVVDDSASMRIYIIKILQRMGFNNIVVADDGMDGIGKYQQAIEENSPFHFVISDWKMPKMEGPVFLRHIRQLKKFNTVPFLMVTAQKEKQDIQRAISEGVSSYIVKPFTQIILEEKILELVKKRSTYKIDTSLKVLVVDDSASIRVFIKGVLKKIGLTNLLVAEDGKKALEQLNNSIKERAPVQFIITDWNMPHMTGIQFTEKIRNMKSQENTPILMITSKSEEEDLKKALKSGVTGFLSKPVNREKLEMKMKLVLSGLA